MHIRHDQVQIVRLRAYVQQRRVFQVVQLKQLAALLFQSHLHANGDGAAQNRLHDHRLATLHVVGQQRAEPRPALQEPDCAIAVAKQRVGLPRRSGGRGRHPAFVLAGSVVHGSTVMSRSRASALGRPERRERTEKVKKVNEKV